MKPVGKFALVLGGLTLAFTPAVANAEEGSRTDNDSAQVTVIEESATEGGEMTKQAPHPLLTHAEYPHKSGADVSGHGYWTTSDPTLSGKKATVKVWLQARTSSGVWIYAATAEPVDVYPGGGSGKRGVARVGCKTTGARYWRTVTDVDINWMPDTFGKKYSKEIILPCTI